MPVPENTPCKLHGPRLNSASAEASGTPLTRTSSEANAPDTASPATNAINAMQPPFAFIMSTLPIHQYIVSEGPILEYQRAIVNDARLFRNLPTMRPVRHDQGICIAIEGTGALGDVVTQSR